MKKLLTLSLALLLIFISFNSIAQLNRRQIQKNNFDISTFRGKIKTPSKYVSVAFGLNSMNYFGDIAPKSGIFSTKISSTRPGFTAAVIYNTGLRVSFQASLSYGTLYGDDNVAADPSGENSRFRYVRNLSFKNNITELAVVGMFELFGNQGTYLSRRTITPYVLIGIAGFHHNPQAKVPKTNVHTGQPMPEAGQWVKLRPLGTEGQYANLEPTDANFGNKPYSLWQLSIPFGLGTRFRLGEALDISFDISFRYLFFDYIDDLSNNYVDLGVLDSDLAKVMSDRSREPTSANTGNIRNLTAWPETKYTSTRDGQTYTVTNGFGSERIPNKRGNPGDNDIYYVTSIKLIFILGSSYGKAKFR